MARGNTIVSFDPFAELFGLVPAQKHAQQREPFFGLTPITVNAIKADVREEDDKYVVEANFPGVAKEDIDVSYDDGVLTLSYEKNSEQDNVEEKHDYKIRERFFESASRSFRIEGVDENAIEATLDAGVLTIVMPKNVESAPEMKKIKIM